MAVFYGTCTGVSLYYITLYWFRITELDFLAHLMLEVNQIYVIKRRGIDSASQLPFSAPPVYSYMRFNVVAEVTLIPGDVSPVQYRICTLVTETACVSFPAPQGAACF